MRKFAIVILTSLGLTACNPFGGIHTYRYRVTVEVDTSQGVRSGSSVWETSALEGSGIPDRGVRSRARGEAVAVDLPGGTLFALLRGQNMDADYPSGVVPSHLKAHPQPGADAVKNWGEIMRTIAETKPTFELYPDERPLLVRFRDLGNPATVEKVDPADLASSFGPGTRLRRIAVAVTDDDVTVGIERRFGWWKNYLDRRLNGAPRTTENMRDPDLSAHLSVGSFSTEYDR